MNYLTVLLAGSLVVLGQSAFSQWLDVSDVTINKILTEHNGPMLEISYELNAEDITDHHPAYVFIRYSRDGGTTWKLLDQLYLQGEGAGIVSSPGLKKVVVWGSEELGLNNPQIKVRGIHMARVPAGDFKMKSFPAGGKDSFRSERPSTIISEFYMAVNETTISMYTSYLNEMGNDGSGWHDRMADERRGGIIPTDTLNGFVYAVRSGREDHPITYVSWYDACSFLQWCGLVLPSEVMFEKAYVGGFYLDGDDAKEKKNPLPERQYPWGNELPSAKGIYRCNYDGDEDGYSNLAPVGTFGKFGSPYGINDLAGNVAEWTVDWYNTTYHIGLDGFRMVRGGSWLDMPLAVDAVSGATQFPIKESSIMGFRGVFCPD
ncbi:MAG: SUMF1/EgtB/PvdO family nonheme iron enzyme [Saprospiraceae bacterium]|nr:SUMF1/EgtB/PvdO family nonheme iron enzyme [Saprospiraceae bacterium]